MAGQPGLIYQNVFCPRDIKDHGDLSRANFDFFETYLRIKVDHDGDYERVLRLPLINATDASKVFQSGGDITVEIRLGNALVPEKRDPLYVMISDEDHASIGFKISESGPIKGAEGEPGYYLTDINLRGEDSETASLERRDYPDEFHITIKPKQAWGSIFCSQGNGTKQCVSYGKNVRFARDGLYFDLYREKMIEEYLINYIEVKIYRGGLVSQ